MLHLSTQLLREFFMSEIVLSCKNVVKSFGKGEAEVFALRGITIDVYKQELLMLVGPSGCGKTTFVSCISGLLAIDSGECTLLGQNIRAMDDDTLVLFRRENIGFVFQSFNLISALSAIENVILPLTIAGDTSDALKYRAKELLDAVGLASKYDVKPANLSGGEQQRVAIARALIHQPQLIICDEPTSSLDHKAGEAVMQLLATMQKKYQTTIIVVTHDNRIYKYANTIASMEDGKIIGIKRGRE
jgi:putative ABC transport system ATP-binding protein